MITCSRRKAVSRFKLFVCLSYLMWLKAHVSKHKWLQRNNDSWRKFDNLTGATWAPQIRSSQGCYRYQPFVQQGKTLTCINESWGLPYRLREVTTYGVYTTSGMLGKTVLGLYKRLIMECLGKRIKGMKRKGVMWFGEKPAWENRGKRGQTCKQLADTYACLTMPCTWSPQSELLANFHLKLLYSVKGNLESKSRSLEFNGKNEFYLVA